MAPMVGGAVADPTGDRRPLYLLNLPSRRVSPFATPLLMKGVSAPLTLPNAATVNIPLPTPVSDRVAVFPDGRAAVIARGEIDLRSHRRFVSLTQLGAKGDTVLARRVEVEPGPADTRWLETRLEEIAEAFARFYPSGEASWRAVRKAWRTNADFSPVAGLFADNGRSRMDSHESSHESLARIRLPVQCEMCVTAPGNARLLAANRDHARAVTTDADGMHTNQRFPLQRQ
jgi:hypothetical protein